MVKQFYVSYLLIPKPNKAGDFGAGSLAVETTHMGLVELEELRDHINQIPENKHHTAVILAFQQLDDKE